MKKNSTVTQNNQIIESRYRLSREEQKVLKILISTIKPKTDKNFVECVFNIRDLADFLGIRMDGAYSFFDDVTDRLHSRTLQIRDDKAKKFIKHNWVTTSEYDGEKGIIRLKLNPDLKQFFLDLKGSYTKYELEYIMALSNTYAIRFYEIGKKNIGRNQRKTYIDLADLKKMLGIGRKKYADNNNFKRRVMETAQKDINKKTDIDFNFEPVRKGRGGKIVGYTLEFASKQQIVASPLPETVFDTLDQLKALDINDISVENVQKWLDKYDSDKLRVAIEVAQENRSKGKNVGAGLIVDALSKGWLSKAEEKRVEQREIREKEEKKRLMQEARSVIEKLKNKHTDEVWTTALDWFDDFPEGEQEAFKKQYMSQNSLIAEKERKATSPTHSFNSHVVQLYKKNNEHDSFSAWLEKHAKKKGIKITKEMWLAAAEIK